LREVFLEVLRDHTAGDPMNADVKWTNLSRRQIARRLQERGKPVSRRIVSQLLREHGYRRRKALKKKTLKQHPDRNAQFEKIGSSGERGQ
jgi:DDE family transposase/transposase